MDPAYSFGLHLGKALPNIRLMSGKSRVPLKLAVKRGSLPLGEE